jgi:hypothetical protein
MAIDLVDRLAILVAVQRFPSMGTADSRVVERCESYACMKEFERRSTSVPFRRFLGDVRREFMQRLFVVLHGKLGSYLRDALHEGGVTLVECLPTPRTWASALVVKVV